MPAGSNEFFEGIDTDSDALRIKRSKARHMRNIRLLNIEGQGWVATNIEGNELQFQLTQGFIPLGYGQYNGIAYILSTNPSTGEGEIGCYPSPDPSCTGGFLDVYAPLRNFTGNVNPLANPNAPRLPFRTTLFDFDCEHQIECTVRIDYDKSVNIYWCDQQKHPVRVVNSGFNQEGVCNNRLYWTGSFPNGIEVNAETCSVIQPSMVSIDPTGQLRAGNWIFYFRYNTLDFNPTSFNGESGPVQIGPDWIPAGITVDGAAGLTVTDKSVTFLLSNLDPSYPYIEIAYVYNYEGLTEVRLIDNLYNNSTTGSTQVTITGSESVINFTEADIIRKKVTDDIPKTLTQLENRLWIANLMERNLFHPDLVAFAKCIVARPDDTLQFDDRPFATGQSFFTYGQYKDHFKTYNSIGYFRGETYAFAVRFVFKSGRLSEPIPVSGYDAWLDPAALSLNDQGILRFPNQGQSPFFTSTNPVTGEGLINVMGIKFDTTLCVPTQWMIDNICGWFFTRCDKRNENLIYQGLVLNCYNEVGSGPVQCPSGINGPPTDVRSPNWIPLWAYSFYAGPTSTSYPAVDIRAVFGTDRVFAKVASNQPFRKYGLYSPDHFFKKNLGDGAYFIGRFATYSPLHNFPSATHIPGVLTEVGNMTFFPIQVGDAVARNILPWTQADNNGFVSLFPEGSAGDSDSFYYSQRSCLALSPIERKNRKFATSRYIGLDLAASANFVNIDAGYTPSCVNIYRNHPITNFILTNQYIVRNTTYCNISNFISISNFQIVVPTTVYYRGDCFVSREYFKQLYNPDFYPIALQDSVSNYYTFGVVHSMITENSYNVDLRHADANNTYYPELGLGNPGAFIWDNIKYESELFNEGYNVALGIDCAFGYDSLIPFRGNCYPTRIRFSNKHTQNSFSDGYRIFDVAGFQDYDYRMGPINKIIDFQARLFSIQDSGLNVHFVNDRAAISQGTSQAELLIGTGDVLAAKAQNITDMYGTQHQWSVIKTERAFYGVDWNKRKIWRFTGSFEPLSDTKLIRSLMHEVIEQYSDHSDIIHLLVDNPVCREGILSAYDRKFNDVVFNFIFDQKVREPKKQYSLRFNELIDAFTGEYNNITPFMLSLNEDFFTANPQIFNSQQTVPSTNGDFWLEGRDITSSGNPNKTTFYNTLFSCEISYITNTEPDLTKIFDNKHINSGNQTPESISYSTQHQLGVQNPFVTGTNRHIDPIYRENQWRVPVRRADSVYNPVNNIYLVGSPLRGTWLQTTLSYINVNPIFVKSVITEFRISKQ